MFVHVRAGDRHRPPDTQHPTPALATSGTNLFLHETLCSLLSSAMIEFPVVVPRHSQLSEELSVVSETGRQVPTIASLTPQLSKQTRTGLGWLSSQAHACSRFHLSGFLPFLEGLSSAAWQGL